MRVPARHRQPTMTEKLGDIPQEQVSRHCHPISPSDTMTSRSLAGLPPPPAATRPRLARGALERARFAGALEMNVDVLQRIAGEVARELVESGVKIEPSRLAFICADCLLKNFGKPAASVARATIADLLLPAIVAELPTQLN